MSATVQPHNKLVVFVSAFLLKLCGGYAVGLGALNVELPRLLGIEDAFSFLPLGLVCLGLAIGLHISGPTYLRLRSRDTCLLGTGMFGTSVYISASCLERRMPWVALATCSLAGIGMGLNYQSIVAVMGECFPTTPLATSTIGPFGSAAGISLHYLHAYIFDFPGSSLAEVTAVMKRVGLLIVAIALTASRGLPRPSPNVSRSFSTLPPERSNTAAARRKLAILLFANTLPGMTLFVNIITTMRRYDVGNAATCQLLAAACTLALFAGGLLAPTLVSVLGYERSFSALFLIRSIFLGIAALRPSPVSLGLAFATVLFGHGSGFGMIPALVKRQDELPRFPLNSCRVLSGWGFGGFFGALLSLVSWHVTGSPNLCLLLLSAFTAMSGLVIIATQPAVL